MIMDQVRNRLLVPFQSLGKRCVTNPACCGFPVCSPPLNLPETIFATVFTIAPQPNAFTSGETLALRHVTSGNGFDFWPASCGPLAAAQYELAGAVTIGGPSCINPINVGLNFLVRGTQAANGLWRQMRVYAYCTGPLQCLPPYGVGIPLQLACYARTLAVGGSNGPCPDAAYPSDFTTFPDPTAALAAGNCGGTCVESIEPLLVDVGLVEVSG